MSKKKVNVDSILKKLNLFSNSGAWGQLKNDQFDLILDDVTSIVGDSEIESAKSINVKAVLSMNEELSSIVQTNFLLSFSSVYWPELERSLIDDYLITYGEKEDIGEKEYLKQINDSEMDLLEVLSIEESTMLLKSIITQKSIELLAKDEELNKIECGDILACRSITLNGNNELAKGYLVFSENQYANIKEGLQGSLCSFEESFNEEYGEHNIDEALKERIYNQCLADWFLQIWLSMLFEKFAIFSDYMNAPDKLNGSPLINLQFKIKPGSKQQIKDELYSMFKKNGSHLLVIDENVDSFVTLKKRIIEFSLISKDHVIDLRKIVVQKFGDLIEHQPIISYENINDLMSGIKGAMLKDED